MVLEQEYYLECLFILGVINSFLFLALFVVILIDALLGQISNVVAQIFYQCYNNCCLCAVRLIWLNVMSQVAKKCFKTLILCPILRCYLRQQTTEGVCQFLAILFRLKKIDQVLKHCLYCLITTLHLEH